MATWEDVERIALSLPQTSEGTSYGNRSWKIGGKTSFVTDRPLGKKDRAALGPGAPDGPTLLASVEHELAKRALIADDPDVFFTVPHFDGYPAILVWLDAISVPLLEEVIVEAWLVSAPPAAVRAYQAAR
jgi:hypothetical protein